MLHAFLTSNRAELINRCREKVAKRSPPGPAGDAHGAPLFLLQLVDTLCREQLATIRRTLEPEKTPAPTAIGRAAALHGAELLRNGYSIDQVVHDYGDICQAVTEMAIEQKAPVTIAEFHTLNRCLDNAIADAVTAFASGPDDAIPDQAESGQKRVVPMDEQRRLIHAAIQAISAVKTGNIGLSGATGAVLLSALGELRNVIDQSSPEMRRQTGSTNVRSVPMAARRLRDPPFSVSVESGKWYWGAVCLNCERPVAIKPAEITSTVPYPEQTSVVSIQCSHCLHIGHYPGHTIRSFRVA
jgi:hypothetical protein